MIASPQRRHRRRVKALNYMSLSIYFQHVAFCTSGHPAARADSGVTGVGASRKRQGFIARLHSKALFQRATLYTFSMSLLSCLLALCCTTVWKDAKCLCMLAHACTFATFRGVLCSFVAILPSPRQLAFGCGCFNLPRMASPQFFVPVHLRNSCLLYCQGRDRRPCLCKQGILNKNAFCFKC